MDDEEYRRRLVEDDWTNMPRSRDPIKLSMGHAVTACCGAFVTYHDDVLCCKGCWHEIF